MSGEVNNSIHLSKNSEIGAVGQVFAASSSETRLPDKKQPEVETRNPVKCLKMSVLSFPKLDLVSRILTHR